MIATLPMYDWPEVHDATNALWVVLAEGFRAAGLDPPLHLNRGNNLLEDWVSPDLFLGQTCGLPYANVLQGRVRLLGTPHYCCEGCEGPNYSSAILVRADDRAETTRGLAGATVAVNDWMSQSGRAAWHRLANPLERALRPQISGSHRQSLRWVAEGRVRACAVDAVCWHLARQFEAEACANLRVIAFTRPTPGLPMITTLDTPPASVALMQNVLKDVMSGVLDRDVRDSLGLCGFSVFEPADYSALRDPSYVDGVVNDPLFEG